MPTIILAPYHLGSKSARSISNAISGSYRIRPVNSRYVWRPHHRVVNWGRSHVSFPVALNQAEAVQAAINKQRTWDRLSCRGIGTVSYRVDTPSAREWLNSGVVLYYRETLTGHGGNGIRVFHTVAELDEARLPLYATYTKRFPVHREFRCTVVRDEIVLVSEKKKRTGVEADQYVRNHAGGWVFCRNDLNPYPEAIKEQSIAAIKALGLDFGGVDIAIDKENNTCVFEVNTAPGVEGSAVQLLAAALERAVCSS